MEGVRALRWAIGRLEGDALLVALLPGGVHRTSRVPQRNPRPGLTVDVLADADKTVVGQHIVGADALLLVTVWGGPEHSIDDLEPIMDRAHVVLHRADGTSGDAEIWSCTRRDKLPLGPEVVNGVVYERLAARYAVELTQVYA
jgi:hypothetical protein